MKCDSSIYVFLNSVNLKYRGRAYRSISESFVLEITTVDCNRTNFYVDFPRIWRCAGLVAVSSADINTLAAPCENVSSGIPGH